MKQKILIVIGVLVIALLAYVIATRDSSVGIANEPDDVSIASSSLEEDVVPANATSILESVAIVDGAATWKSITPPAAATSGEASADVIQCYPQDGMLLRSDRWTEFLLDSELTTNIDTEYEALVMRLESAGFAHCTPETGEVAGVYGNVGPWYREAFKRGDERVGIDRSYSMGTGNRLVVRAGVAVK